MANPLYNEMNPVPNGMANSMPNGQDFTSCLNMLKSSVSNPNAMIQQMLNSGKITQEQYNLAGQLAQQIQQMRRR